MRFLALTPVVVALGLGGVALAEPAGIVDPWSGSTNDADSWFAREASAPAPSQPLDAALKDPWAPPVDAQATPSIAAPRRLEVIPLAPATAASKPAAMTRTEVSVVDPWAPPVIASETPSLAGSAPAKTDRSRGAPWTERFVEIVDPWKRMPEYAATDRVRLIVDPWAR